MASYKSLTEFIGKYGERGYILLRAILEEADSNWANPVLGDFNFKGIKNRLRSYGIDYNPSLLLSRLEREYGVIETSYKSSSQHWWRITDREAIEEVVRLKEGKPPRDEEDPRMRMLRIQFYSLEPERMLEVVKRASRSSRLNEYIKKQLRKIVFEDLPLLVDFLERAKSEYPEDLLREITLAETIIESLEKAIIKHGYKRHTSLYEALPRDLAEPGEYDPERGL
ncbi:MAG: hypothetical protein GSR85_09965 [Desulfurococcales archaeon]|nr:hypothetical protein [Desulfurococcales archaeon]